MISKKECLKMFTTLATEGIRHDLESAGMTIVTTSNEEYMKVMETSILTVINLFSSFVAIGMPFKGTELEMIVALIEKSKGNVQ